MHFSKICLLILNSVYQSHDAARAGKPGSRTKPTTMITVKAWAFLVVCKASRVMRKRLAKSLNLPMEVRPHVGAAPAASLTREPRLQVGQAHVIPAIDRR
jgi:hypothetical protein